MRENQFNVPIARTSLVEEEIQSVLEPLRSGWLVQGPKVAEFEKRWCEFTDVKHSIAVTSCTTALHLSLAALGFGAGDEAIVPAFTWISTANVVEHLGGRVRFADIDLKTFNMNIDAIESLINKNTKAIIPVHLFGLSASMDEINYIAKKYDIWVVEDAACGFGAYYKGQHVGAFGHTGCFSFHPRKSITTGEGGMVTTNDDNIAEKLRKLRDHGAAISDLQRHHGPKPFLLADHPVAGYNQRMTDVQAALGVAQMKRAHQILNERRRLAQIYNDAFKALDWLQIPLTTSRDLRHGYQSYPCLYEPEKVKKAVNGNDYEALRKIRDERNEWMEELQNCGISTRPATHAVHMLSYYKQKYSLQPENYIAALAANDCSISLPLFHGLREDEQNYVISKVAGRTQ